MSPSTDSSRPALEPALTLDSGDKGRYHTPDVLWNIENYKEGDLARRMFGPQEPPRNDKTLPCGSGRGARGRDRRGAGDPAEVSGTTIGCPMERVGLRYVVWDELKFDVPRARTPDSWITCGFNEDLPNEAATKALNRYAQPDDAPVRPLA